MNEPFQRDRNEEILNAILPDETNTKLAWSTKARIEQKRKEKLKNLFGEDYEDMDNRHWLFKRKRAMKLKLKELKEQEDYYDESEV